MKQNLDDFLFELRSLGIDLVYSEQKLKVQGQKELISPEILAALAAKRSELLSYFQSNTPQHYPLAASQIRMWMAYFNAAGIKPTHNLSALLRLQDDFSFIYLKEAMQNLLDQYEILRTGYQSHNGQARAIIFPHKIAPYSFEELSNEDEIKKWVERSSEQLLHLETGEVIRFLHAFEKQGNRHFLLIIAHHIALDFDGFQMALLALAEIYEALIQRKSVPVPECQYRHYVLENRTLRNKEAYGKALDYWKSQISHDHVRLPFKWIHSDKTAPRKNGIYIEELNESVSLALRDYSQSTGVTPHNFLLGLYQILMEKFFNQKILHIGLSISTRGKSYQKCIGFCADMYWIKTQAHPEESVLFSQIRDSMRGGLSNLACGLEDIFSYLGIQRTPEFFPIFQIVFNWTKSPIHQGNNTLFKSYHGIGNTGFNRISYDLMLSISNVGGEFRLVWLYNMAYFTQEKINSLSNEYKNMIKSRVFAGVDHVDKCSI